MEYWDPLTVFSTSIESTQNTNQNGTISFDERCDNFVNVKNNL